MPSRNLRTSTPFSDNDDISLNTSAIAVRAHSSSWTSSIFPSTAERFREAGLARTGSNSSSEQRQLLDRSGWGRKLRRDTQSDRPRRPSIGRPETSPETLPQPHPAGAAVDDYLGFGAQHQAPPAANQGNPGQRERHAHHTRRHTVPRIEVTAPTVPGNDILEVAMAARQLALTPLQAARHLQAQGNVAIKFKGPLHLQPAAQVNAHRQANVDPGLPRPPPPPNAPRANANGARDVQLAVQQLAPDEEAFDVLMRYGATVEFPQQPPAPPVPVDCDVCQAYFNTEALLRQHQQSHTLCDVCRGRYSEHTTYAEHVRLRHPPGAIPGAFHP